MSIDPSKMPKLGFGLMRLPENDGVIDHEQVCRMVDKYLEAGLIQRSGKASDCIACGQCEGVCPQHLPIIDLMKEAAEILGQ